MASDFHHSDRNYRRGAIMGLTMAEAFILICFALLLLFAFWQWEVEKENTPDVKAFKELTSEQRQTILVSSEDGSIEAFVSLKEKGMDFSVPGSVENPQEKWRFIDEDEMRRLMDAASELPKDIQRDLADMVEANRAAEILKEMAVLEELVESGTSVADMIASSEAAKQIEQSGLSVEELLYTAKVLEALAAMEMTVDELIDTAAALDNAGQTLEEISSKIRDAELQEAALVSALRSELGDVVAKMGGKIDDTGAIILPDRVLFGQGKANVTPNLAKFLAQACQPWLSVLRTSGVDISEVKIEGHASSEWRSNSSPRAAFLGNLDLSQRRSQAVLRVCLDFVNDSELLEWARRHMIAVGYSSVRPVLTETGLEDRTASRRVVFSATPNRKSLLDEIETDAQIAQYDRSLFGGWEDQDSDCQNTRQELLQSLSTGTISLAQNNCTVIRGKWRDPYTEKVFSNAKDIQIDHLVPLKWAWDHGAHSWSEEKRADFANDNSNLFAVAGYVNQEKGAQGPLTWLPPSENFHCQYITRFSRVTAKYGLALSTKEQSLTQQLLREKC